MQFKLRHLLLETLILKNLWKCPHNQTKCTSSKKNPKTLQKSSQISVWVSQQKVFDLNHLKLCRAKFLISQFISNRSIEFSQLPIIYIWQHHHDIYFLKISCVWLDTIPNCVSHSLQNEWMIFILSAKMSYLNK